MKSRKPPTEKEVTDWLRRGKLTLQPLRFHLEEVATRLPTGQRWDYVIEARWDEEVARFSVEYNALFNPKAFEAGLSRCLTAPRPKGCLPLLMLPYLRLEQLEALEEKGVSGVDWCGNGVVITKKLRVFRTGAPNRFLTDSPIKNIYRKNTSLVPSVFFARPSFNTVGEVVREIGQRNGFAISTGSKPITMGTVSKALKQLEDDLVIDREEGIRLLQPEKLLDLLARNYQLARTRSVRLKVDCAFDRLPEWLGGRVRELSGLALVATGLASVDQYASMQRSEVLSVYCSDVDLVRNKLGGSEFDRFPNIELVESDEPALYFDARESKGFLWASPLQTWLELQAGDKRDKETSEQVREFLLRKARAAS